MNFLFEGGTYFSPRSLFPALTHILGVLSQTCCQYLLVHLVNLFSVSSQEERMTFPRTVNGELGEEVVKVMPLKPGWLAWGLGWELTSFESLNSSCNLLCLVISASVGYMVGLVGGWNPQQSFPVHTGACLHMEEFPGRDFQVGELSSVFMRVRENDPRVFQNNKLNQSIIWICLLVVRWRYTLRRRRNICCVTSVSAQQSWSSLTRVERAYSHPCWRQWFLGHLLGF